MVYHMTETLVGLTTRTVTFTAGTNISRQYPAGTAVYARLRRNGREFAIRVPGTLYSQHVTPDTLAVP
jgi:hypothetical protein